MNWIAFHKPPGPWYAVLTHGICCVLDGILFTVSFGYLSSSLGLGTALWLARKQTKKESE